MKGILYCIVLFLGLVAEAGAQSIQGRITDKNGTALPGATLYLREIAAGAVADENGAFQMELPAGVYTCEISALGYEKQIRQLNVLETEVLRVDVQLKEMSYMLSEVKVTRSKEDPAYYFMRHAIANAPFHLNQVRSFRAEIYTKGTMQLEKMPKLLMLSKEVRKEVSPYIGKLFLLESVTDLKFEAPDKYERNILAFSSTIPDEMNAEDAMDVLSASIYEPNVVGVISPLSPGAFSYYRFRLEEYYMEGERSIAKIGVIPRKDNRMLARGWICISEKDWSVVRFDLTVENMGMTLGIKCMYHEVKPTVFLPTSYDIDVRLKLLGIHAGGKYYAAVKYKEVNAEIQEEIVPVVLVAPVAEQAAQEEIVAEKEKASAKVSKEEKMRKQLEELQEKDNLSTREAYRMARISRQLLKPERPDTVAPLEIREQSVQVRTRVDSLAMKRDSLYWLRMRTIPLKKEEVVSYQKKDSLREVVKKAERESDTLSLNSLVGGTVLMGENIRLKQGVWLRWDGLLKAVPEYNFADGFWIGQKLELNVHAKRKRHLILTPSLYYATARKTWLWQVKGKYVYAPMRRGVLEAGVGYVSADYKGTAGGIRFENTLTSLVCADNFMKFYSNRYVRFRNAVDLVNGLRLEITGKYEKRRILENRITYNFFKKDAEPNLPSWEGGVNMPDNTALVLGVNIDYTPYYYYRIDEGRKEYLHSDWPTFSIGYERGVSLNEGHDSSFERLQLGIRQDIKMGYFDRISYEGQIGKFFSVREIYFPDYKHFGTTGWIWNTDGFETGFFVADYYRLHTRDKWAYGGLNYLSEYLLLKRLPFLQHSLMDEAVHLRYLWTPGLRNYAETGYSLGVFDAIRAGVFVGWDRDGYQGVGMRISISLNEW